MSTAGAKGIPSRLSATQCVTTAIASMEFALMLCKMLAKGYMAAMSDIRKVPNRRVVAVTGDDAAPFLGGLVTNGPPQTGGCLSALLTPQGKVLFDFNLYRSENGYFADIHSDAADDFLKRLNLYRLRAKVDIDSTSEYAVFVDIDAPGIVKFIAELSTHNGVPFDIEYHQRRIAHGVAEWGLDFDSNEVFPMDVNFDLIGGVDYKKGCFVGQEVASRMKRKGDARKRTLVARFDGAPPTKGAAVTAGDSTLGSIMSGVDGAALAIIRMDRWNAAIDDGRELRVGDCAVTLHRPDYMGGQ